MDYRYHRWDWRVVPEAELLNRLRQAIADRLIPSDLGGRIDAIVRAISRLAVGALLDATEAEGKSSLGDLLESAGLDADEQEAVLAAFLAHTGDFEAFWADLRKDATRVNPEKIDGIEYSLQLAWLTQRQTEVLKGIREAYPNARSTPRTVPAAGSGKAEGKSPKQARWRRRSSISWLPPIPLMP